MINDMPYTNEAVTGTVYSIGEQLLVKDLYSFQRDKERWRNLSTINTTAAIELLPNTIIIKEGKVVASTAIEKGDELLVMSEEAVDLDIQEANTQVSVVGYIIIVK